MLPGFSRHHRQGRVKRVPLPPRSPRLHAFAERWGRSVTEEALSKLILWGARALRYALKAYTPHFHTERPHQGIGNVIPLPASRANRGREVTIQCREWLGGLLKYYEKQAT
jgi:hypothetical protein